ncbi:Iq-domain [Thalictrum thalictroides]|uniref:Iq-domain n=1 Tax=Thalictrum thalictroides TaxID=46969 RepID=A0A7J6X1T1_THATH|nr:Iq-domain [Thalictrum thalictroides]
MGKTSKWLRNFLTGKKEKDKGSSTSNQQQAFISTDEIPTTPIALHPSSTPKEKRRWSFRRSASGSKDFTSIDSIVTTPPRSARHSMLGAENDQKQHSLVVIAATRAATDVAVSVAKATASGIRLSSASNRRSNALQEAAATMIQAVFRSYLARKALRALKGLVKLQALVRGHLVRKQAVTTLRCMQALVNVQVRTRAQRIQLAGEAQYTQRLSNYRRSPQKNCFRQTYNVDKQMDDIIKVVEMDLGRSRGHTRSRSSYSIYNYVDEEDQRYSPNYHAHLKQEYHCHRSPAQSALAEMSSKVCSRHFDEYSLSTEQSSPCSISIRSKPDPIKVPCSSPQPYIESVCHEQTFFPNYMANTASFKAKVRSQSAPKQRSELFERQTSKKKVSVDWKNITRTARMQRSSSQVGSGGQEHQFPCSIKLDRSSISLKESECGSTSTLLADTNYCRSLAAYEVSIY